MCDQCESATLGWALFPGWTLVKARLDSDSMKAGDWGLVRQNDPDFVWRKPAPGPLDPLYGLTEEEERKIPKEDPRWETSSKWTRLVDGLKLKPSKGYNSHYPNVYYELVAGGISAGYNPNTDGNFNFWLFQRMGELVNKWPEGQRSCSTHNPLLRLPLEKRNQLPSTEPEVLDLDKYVSEMQACLSAFQESSRKEGFWGDPKTRGYWDECLFAYLHQTNKD